MLLEYRSVVYHFFNDVVVESFIAVFYDMFLAVRNIKRCCADICHGRFCCCLGGCVISLELSHEHLEIGAIELQF